jgi:hypothetical protein
VTNDDGSEAAPIRAPRAAADMMHIAGYSKPEPKLRSEIAPADKKVAKPADKPIASVAKAKPAAAVKPVKTATADPLGPLPGAAAKAKSDSGSGSRESRPISKKTTKDPGSRQ